MDERPRIGISACLLGEPVRYDGRDKHDPAVVAALANFFTLVPLCPEVEAGFGVPREPMDLVSSAAGATRRLSAITRSGRDLTAPLEETSERLARQASEMRLSGFVLKSRSPSCGIGTVPIYDASGARVSTGSGLFASTLGRLLPSLPVEDELRLADASVLESFVERVLACARATAPSPSSPPTERR